METTILFCVLASLPVAWLLGHSLDSVFTYTCKLFPVSPTVPMTFERQLERKIASNSWWTRLATL